MRGEVIGVVAGGERPDAVLGGMLEEAPVPQVDDARGDAQQVRLRGWNVAGARFPEADPQVALVALLDLAGE